MSTSTRLESLDDEALFARYTAGEGAAFQALFARFAPLFTRIVRRRVFDPVQAQDLVQQTFLQLHRARHDFRVGGKLRPWAVTICMNVVRQHFRRVQRATELPLEDDGAWMPTVGPHDPVRAEAARQLHAALAQLPEGTRRAIELHWLEGMPFPEVAEALGISTSAVKVRAHRGYQRLRELLERLGVTAQGAPAPDPSEAEQG